MTLEGEGAVVDLQYRRKCSTIANLLNEYIHLTCCREQRARVAAVKTALIMIYYIISIAAMTQKVVVGCKLPRCRWVCW